MHEMPHPPHVDWRASSAMPHQPDQYRTIVDRAMELARTCTEEPIRIADISRAAGVSARTLVRAFRAIHGATPYRYLSSLRLLDARQALLSGNEKPETVTEVATRFGFGELGRFSAAYRSAFGESPSATLRRSSQPKQAPPLRAADCNASMPSSHAIETPVTTNGCPVVTGRRK